jgi:Zn-dependent peptidase ImmA (M78 family)
MYSPQQILDTYWDRSLPVNVEGIARTMGMDVQQKYLFDESGSIELMNDGKYVITVNATENELRRRFTIAHEIGHYALGHIDYHRRICRDDLNSLSTGNFNPYEREANKFAAELLMPERVVRFAIADRGYTTTESLARIFGVSEVAMSWRLHNLGIVRRY